MSIRVHHDPMSAATSISAALLLLLLFACANCAHGFYVCLISEAEGFTLCDPNTSPLSWTGYDVDNWRWIAKELRWNEGVDYGDAPVESGNFTFRCESPDWNGMMERLANDSQYAVCAAAMGEVSITTGRIRMGVQFSESNYRAGVGVLVANNYVTRYSSWAFLRPFDWTLWLAMLLTLLAVPLVLWFIEAVLVEGRVVLSFDSLEDIQMAVFRTSLTCFNLGPYEISRLPAQVVFLAFAFMVQIVVTNYLANLVAALSEATVQEAMSELSQLQGTAVAAYGIYVNRSMLDYGLTNVRELDWSDTPSSLAVLSQLQSGRIDAYIFDVPVLQAMLMTNNSQCRFRLMDQVMFPVDYGLAFHRRFPTNIIKEINLQMKAARDSGYLFLLQRRYIYYADLCAQQRTKAKADSISFTQLRGLWIVLSGVICVVFVWSCVAIGLRVRHHMGQLHKEASQQLPAAADASLGPPDTTPGSVSWHIQEAAAAASTSQPASSPPQARRARPMFRAALPSKRKIRLVRKAFARVFVRVRAVPKPGTAGSADPSMHGGAAHSSLYNDPNNSTNNITFSGSQHNYHSSGTSNILNHFNGSDGASRRVVLQAPPPRADTVFREEGMPMLKKSVSIRDVRRASHRSS